LQAEDGIRDFHVTGVQTCALPIYINDVKVKHATGAKVVEMATPEEVQQLLACDIGSLGPINLPAEVRLFADHAVENMVNGVAGRSEERRVGRGCRFRWWL